MDLLLMLAVYCVLFIVGALCLLYRDSLVMCTGPIGTFRQVIAEAINRVVPLCLQNLAQKCCNKLLYTRTSFFQVMFAVLVILGHAVWVVDMIPILYRHYPDHNHTFWPFVVVFSNYICWHKAWTGDPGEIIASNHSKYMTIYEPDGAMYTGKGICSTCKFIKPARSKHCSVCNRCVHRFDHHCIWTNNCVGAFSHRYFILFMVTMLVMFLQGIYVGTGCVLDHAEDIRLFKASYVENDGSIKPITMSVAFQHLFMDLPRLVFLVIALTVLTVLVGIFLIHHLYLVLTNQTTNERYKLYDLRQASHTSQMCSDNGDSKTENRGAAKSEDHEKSKQDRVKTKTDLKYSVYRPYSRGAFNNFMEVFLPYNFINGRIKR